MARLKRNKLLLTILFAVIFYFLTQLLFLSDLKTISSVTTRFSKLFSDQDLTTTTTTTTTTASTTQLTIKEIRNVKNEFNFYLFIYQLPFYHKNNFNYLPNKYQIKLTQIEHDENKNKNSSLNEQINIRGIDKQKAYLYKPDSNNKFKCLYSNQMISFNNLNDDFCDCIDGSDEPGTNACNFNNFYCSTQNDQLTDNFIQSSKVDDKICDCCDGSDERPELKCPNKCDQKIANLKEEKKIYELGLVEKKAYLTNGVGKDENLFGPSGVFYLLSQKCFKIDWTGYTFDLCPYHKVTQSKLMTTNIGHKPKLISVVKSNKKNWILKMENGDSNNCLQPRESEIHFECGISDEIIKVVEPQKCLYVFNLKTPAAC